MKKNEYMPMAGYYYDYDDDYDSYITNKKWI